jgi:hypothetical protein
LEEKLEEVKEEVQKAYTFASVVAEKPPDFHVWVEGHADGVSHAIQHIQLRTSLAYSLVFLTCPPLHLLL